MISSKLRSKLRSHPRISILLVMSCRLLKKSDRRSLKLRSISDLSLTCITYLTLTSQKSEGQMKPMHLQFLIRHGLSSSKMPFRFVMTYKESKQTSKWTWSRVSTILSLMCKILEKTSNKMVLWFQVLSQKKPWIDLECSRMSSLSDIESLTLTTQVKYFLACQTRTIQILIKLRRRLSFSISFTLSIPRSRISWSSGKIFHGLKLKLRSQTWLIKLKHLVRIVPNFQKFWELGTHIKSLSSKLRTSPKSFHWLKLWLSHPFSHVIGIRSLRWLKQKSHTKATHSSYLNF